jgi:hypothetical protein
MRASSVLIAATGTATILTKEDIFFIITIAIFILTAIRDYLEKNNKKKPEPDKETKKT